MELDNRILDRSERSLMDSQIRQGTRVRFTSKRLGVLASENPYRFGEEVVGEGTDWPEGIYLAPQNTPSGEWHSVEVEINGETRICPVHVSQFAPVAQIKDDLIPWTLVGNGWKRALVEVPEGESAPDPGSTKRRIYGPATVLYEQAPDGGIDAQVTR